jgi:negative regulator of sigma E activity
MASGKRANVGRNCRRNEDRLIVMQDNQVRKTTKKVRKAFQNSQLRKSELNAIVEKEMKRISKPYDLLVPACHC